MGMRIFFYAFVVLMGYDLTLADLTKMIFLPDVEEQPPPSCPPNEMYKNCLNNCSNCEDRGFCSYTTCTQSGCDCWPRFFRLTPGGPCEPVGKCPKTECRENEVFRECGPLCERCGLFGCRLIQCNHQCYCKEGFKRDFFGDCVPEEECPQRHRCSKGEEIADSGPVDEFCLQDPVHPRSTEIQNVRKCYCQAGYKRNALGHCIEERLCSYVSCIGNEVYMNCVPACNTTCRNYGDPDCKEDGQCYPGCFCPSGYVMNDYHVCIPIENCETAENDRLLFFVTKEEKKSETSSPATVAAEAQTTIPPEEKTETNSQTQSEVQPEEQSESQSDTQSETNAESQSKAEGAEQSESQTEDESLGEEETQAEKPPGSQDSSASAEAASESMPEEDTQSESDAAAQSQSESVSDEAESQDETDSESKTASESEGDAPTGKEQTAEEAPEEEVIEKQQDVTEEPATDKVDEIETTTTTKAPKQSRRRSSSGSRSSKSSKRGKQFHEEDNEK